MHKFIFFSLKLELKPWTFLDSAAHAVQIYPLEIASLLSLKHYMSIGNLIRVWVKKKLAYAEKPIPEGFLNDNLVVKIVLSKNKEPKWVS